MFNSKGLVCDNQAMKIFKKVGKIRIIFMDHTIKIDPVVLLTVVPVSAHSKFTSALCFVPFCWDNLEVLMDFIRKICSEDTHIKLLPHPPGANELTDFHDNAMDRVSSCTLGVMIIKHYHSNSICLLLYQRLYGMYSFNVINQRVIFAILCSQHKMECLNVALKLMSVCQYFIIFIKQSGE